MADSWRGKVLWNIGGGLVTDGGLRVRKVVGCLWALVLVGGYGIVAGESVPLEARVIEGLFVVESDGATRQIEEDPISVGRGIWDSLVDRGSRTIEIRWLEVDDISVGKSVLLVNAGGEKTDNDYYLVKLDEDGTARVERKDIWRAQAGYQGKEISMMDVRRMTEGVYILGLPESVESGKYAIVEMSGRSDVFTEVDKAYAINVEYPSRVQNPE
jgi:hypothetical protein